MQIKEDKMIYIKDFSKNIYKEYSMLLKYKDDEVHLGEETLDVENPKEFFKYVTKYLKNQDSDIIVRKTSNSFYLFIEEKEIDEIIDLVQVLPIFFNENINNEKTRKLN